jgi:hypothetical protein
MLMPRQQRFNDAIGISILGLLPWQQSGLRAVPNAAFVVIGCCCSSRWSGFFAVCAGKATGTLTAEPSP